MPQDTKNILVSGQNFFQLEINLKEAFILNRTHNAPYYTKFKLI